jgi:hypothetical protein
MPSDERDAEPQPVVSSRDFRTARPKIARTDFSLADGEEAGSQDGTEAESGDGTS